MKKGNLFFFNYENGVIFFSWIWVSSMVGWWQPIKKSWSKHTILSLEQFWTKKSCSCNTTFKES